MGRTPFYDKNGIKRGAWSEEEDAKLRAYVERYGHWNWRELPKFAGLKRCGKSCRLRWLNYLRPDVKRGNYTKEEEDSIIKLHEKLGSKWSVIASSLPGRTDNEIKNHWHTHLKKRVQRKAMRTSSTSEANEQSSISECEANHENGSTTEPSNAHSDIASSQHSSEPRSVELSDCDHDIWRSMDLALEDSAGTSELFTEPCGSDFWSQPFLEDNSDKQNFGFASSSAFIEENGFSLSPYGMSYIDDQFSQWMPYMT